MVPSTMIDLALQRTNSTLSEIGDGDATVWTTRAYQYLNMVKDRIWSKYVASASGKDLSWEEWTQEFTALESEYPLPQVIAEENRAKKIQSLWVSYGTETYTRTGKLKYRQARLIDPANMQQDWFYYEESQSQLDPLYYTSDKSIFVAPVPSTTITDGLKLTGVKKIPDYDANTTESGTVIPDDYHELLVEGLMLQFLYKKGATGMATSLKNDVNNTTAEMINTLKDLNIAPMYMQYPDQTYNNHSSSFPNFPNSW